MYGGIKGPHSLLLTANPLPRNYLYSPVRAKRLGGSVLRRAALIWTGEDAGTKPREIEPESRLGGWLNATGRDPDSAVGG
jgi:hypothetical protein